MEFDKRAYIRSACICVAEIIIDEDNDETAPISIIDLAAGGIKFVAERSDCKYPLGNVYPIRLTIQESGVDMDDILVDIKIRRVELGGHNIHIYGASFEGLTMSQSIRIDEILQYKKRHKKD
jgi:hypothetical protein